MTIKDIKWNEVNRFSQLIAIVLFVGVFASGFMLGKTFEYHAFVNAQKAQRGLAATSAPIADVVYTCDAGKTIEAVYTSSKVDIFLSDKRHLTLPQALSASGARYANADESIVFWNKGNTAFMTEAKKTTFANCATKSGS
jgi:membrane-bound inhibitor of C-type lysozyme